MMRRSTRLAGLSAIALFVVLFLPNERAYAADETQKVFDELYADKIRTAKASRTTADKLALAGELMSLAQATSDQPKLVAVVCRAVNDLVGRVPEGADTAVEAMMLLAKTEPESAGVAAKAMADIRQRQFATSRGAAKSEAGEKLIDALLDAAHVEESAGDPAKALPYLQRARSTAIALRSDRKQEVQDALGATQKKLMAVKKIDQYKAKLKANPEDAASATELLKAYVIELDNPDAARRHTFLTDDTTWKENVLLATRDPESLGADESLKLGDWYHALSREAPKHAKTPMLQRAHGYFDRYLHTGEAEGIHKIKAEVTLKSIAKELEALGDEPGSRSAKGGKRLDLMRLVDLDRHAVKGKWVRGAGGVTNEFGERPSLRFPVLPKGSYELGLVLNRVAGHAMIVVVLPVADRSLRLMLGVEQNSVSVLTQIKRDPAQPQPPRGKTHHIRPTGITTGKDVTLNIKVDTLDGRGEVTVLLGDQPYLGWKGALKDIVGESGTIRPISISVGGNRTRVTIKKALFKMTRGKAELVKD